MALSNTRSKSLDCHLLYLSIHPPQTASFHIHYILHIRKVRLYRGGLAAVKNGRDVSSIVSQDSCTHHNAALPSRHTVSFFFAQLHAIMNNEWSVFVTRLSDELSCLSSLPCLMGVHNQLPGAPREGLFNFTFVFVFAVQITTQDLQKIILNLDSLL